MNAASSSCEWRGQLLASRLGLMKVSLPILRGRSWASFTENRSVTSMPWVRGKVSMRFFIVSVTDTLNQLSLADGWKALIDAVSLHS